MTRERSVLLNIFSLQLAIAQSISGTGALRIGGEFLSAWYPHAKNIIVPNPTWGNHIPIMKNSGLNLEKYTYFDKQTNGLNIDGMLEDLHVSTITNDDTKKSGLTFDV